jgi:hypothetical protein
MAALRKRPLALGPEFQEEAHRLLEIPDSIDRGFYITGVVQRKRHTQDRLSGFCQFL